MARKPKKLLFDFLRTLKTYPEEAITNLAYFVAIHEDQAHTFLRNIKPNISSYLESVLGGLSDNLSIPVTVPQLSSLIQNLNKKARKEITLFPNSFYFNFSFKPIYVYQGVFVFLLTVITLFTTAALLNPNHPSQLAQTDTRLIKTAKIYQTSKAIANQPIKWAVVVNKQDITDSAYLLKLPENAQNIKVQPLTKQETAQYLTQANKERNTQLTLKDRAVLAKTTSGNSLFAMAKTFTASLTNFMVAGVKNALTNNAEPDNIINLEDEKPAKQEKQEEKSNEVAETSDVASETSDVLESSDITDTVSPSDEPVIETPALEQEPEPIINPESIRNSELEIQNSDDEVVMITYETPAPEITEQETDTGKLVTISAEDTRDPECDNFETQISNFETNSNDQNPNVQNNETPVDENVSAVIPDLIGNPETTDTSENLDSLLQGNDTGEIATPPIQNTTSPSDEPVIAPETSDLTPASLFDSVKNIFRYFARFFTAGLTAEPEEQEQPAEAVEADVPAIDDSSVVQSTEPTTEEPAEEIPAEQEQSNAPQVSEAFETPEPATDLPDITETVSPSDLPMIETPAPEQEPTPEPEQTTPIQSYNCPPPLTDVLAYTSIPEIYKVGQEDKIKIKWVNNNDQEVTFHAYDTNNNGKLDYVEWTVPHLSSQTFQIIFISKAWHLDQNREIIEDIYDTVSQQDGEYATIGNNEYVRATFQLQLSNTNDITAHAKPNSQFSISNFQSNSNDSISQNKKSAETAEILETPLSGETRFVTYTSSISNQKFLSRGGSSGVSLSPPDGGDRGNRTPGISGDKPNSTLSYPHRNSIIQQLIPTANAAETPYIRIEIYPVYTDEQGNTTIGPIAALSDPITREGTYKTVLQQLDQPTDTFDLRVVSSSGFSGSSGLDIDFIVDPVTYTATRVWDGGGIDNNWSTCANWTDDTCPTYGDVVQFDSTDSTDCTVDTNIDYLSGLNTTAGYTGAIDFGSSTITGAVGDGAVQFTAADKSILSIADGSQTGLDPGTDDFSVSFWVYFDSLYNWGTIINKSNQYYFYTTSAGACVLAFNDGTGSTTVSSSAGVFTTSQWYFVAITFNRDGNAVVRINDTTDVITLDISGKQGNANNSSSFSIGALDSTREYLNGKLDSLSFSNRLLTASEITWLYNSGNGRIYSDIGIAGTNGSALKTNLVSWWDLGENAGTRYDSHGTNHLSQSFGNIIAPSVYGSELLTNTGFETAGAGGADVFGTWVEGAGDGAIANETTLFHGGAHAAKLTGGATPLSTPNVYQTISVTAGAIYRLSFWTYGDGTNAGRYGIWNNQAGDFISGFARISTGVTGAAWSLVTADVTIPTGCTGIQTLFYAPNVNGGIAYFDDVSLKQITTASINNGGFEGWTVPSMANKVTNSGFETAGGGGADVFGTWSEIAYNGAIEDETSLVHSGGHAAKLTRGTGNTYIYSPSVSVTAGAVYRLSMWTRGDGSYAGRYYVWDGTNGAYIANFVSTSITGATYTLVTYDFTAPTGCSLVSIGIVAPSTDGGYAYFDDVELIQLPSNADSWTESVSGTSRIEREDTAPYYGTNALRMDIDSSNSAAYITQSSLKNGKLYSYTLYAKATSGTPTFYVATSGSSGTIFTLSTSYQSFSGTERVGVSENIIIARQGATSNSIYLDSVTLTAAEILGTTGIPRGQGVGVDYAGQFNGTSQYLSYTGTAFNPGTGDFSVGASFYVDKIPSSVTNTIFNMSSQGTGIPFLWLYSNSAGTYTLQFNDNSGDYVNSTLFTGISVGKWYNLVINFDRDGNATAYLNNAAQTGVNISGQSGTSNPGSFRIGTYGSGSLYFNGRINNAFYANRLLTADEISYLHNNGKGRQFSELGISGTDGSALTSSVINGWWDMDTAGNLGLDSTTNGNNLTNNGTVTQGVGNTQYKGGAILSFNHTGTLNLNTSTWNLQNASIDNSGVTAITPGASSLTLYGNTTWLPSSTQGLGNLTIATSGALTQSANGAIAGNFTNNGTYNYGSYTLSATGTLDQTLDFSGTMSKLIINKPTSGAVTFTSGDTITAGGAWTTAADFTAPSGVNIDLADSSYSHIFGNVTISNGAADTFDMGNSTLTVSGNFDWSGASGAVTYGTSTLVMTGADKQLKAPYNSSPARGLKNLTIDTGASATIPTGSHVIFGLFTLNGSLIYNSSSQLQCSGGITQGADGVMSGTGTLYIATGTFTFANPSTLAPAAINVYRGASIPAGTYSPATLFEITSEVAGDATFTWQSGTYTFTSPFLIQQTGAATGTLSISGANNPTLIFQNNATITQTTGTITFTNNSTNPNQLTGTAAQTINLAGKNMGTWVINKPTSGAVTFTSGDTITAGGAWTIGSQGLTEPAGVSIDLADGSYSHSVSGDVTLDGTAFDMGNSTLTVGGNFDSADVTTWTVGTGTLVMTGASKTITPKASSHIANLTINAGASISQSSNDFLVDTTFTDNGSFSISTGRMFYLYVGCAGSLGSGAVLTGTGTGSLYIYRATNNKGLTSLAGDATVSVPKLYIYAGNATTNVLAAGTYTSGNVYLSNDNSSGTFSLFLSGDYVFTGTLNILNAAAGSTLTINNSTSNPNLTVQGNITVTATNPLIYTKGTGTITLSGAGSGTQTINFLDKTVEDIVINDSGATKQFTDGVTADSLTVTAGTADFNAQTIATTGNLTIGTAGNVTAANLAGATLNIGGNFTASGTDGDLLTLNPSSAWYLNTTGTATASYVNAAYSNASGGAKVHVEHSTDSGHNTNWNFDTTAPTTTASATAGGESYTFDTWTNETQVSVLLTCDDGSGNGCDATYYCTDTTNQCTPSASYTPGVDTISVTDEGTTYIRYYSTDTEGNSEVASSSIVKIDTTNPVTALSISRSETNLNDITATLSCADTGNSQAGSGCALAYYCHSTEEGCAPSTVYTTPVEFQITNTEYFRYYSIDYVSHQNSVQGITINLMGGTANTAPFNPNPPAQSSPEDSVGEATQPPSIVDQIKAITKQPEQITYPPIEEAVPEEPQLPLQGLDLLSVNPLKNFALRPIESTVAFLAEKLPQLKEALDALAIDFTKLGDIKKLAGTELFLPGLTKSVLTDAQIAQINQFAPSNLENAEVEASPEQKPIESGELQTNAFAMVQGVPLAELSAGALAKMPSDVVFARTAGELIDIRTVVSFDEKGNVEQRIRALSGKPIQLVIKPDNPASRVTGLITLSQLADVEQQNSGNALSRFFSAALSLNNPSAGSGQSVGLLVDRFEYEEVRPGVFTANITAPVAEGEYKITTVVEYENVSLQPTTSELVAVIDPEGYVYSQTSEGRVRLEGTTVSIYWLNPETGGYELWPAERFLQKNPIVTNETGKYSFMVPEGMYYLTASAKNYADYRSDVFSVEENNNVYIDIQLKKKTFLPVWLNWQFIVIVLLVIVIALLGIMAFKNKRSS